ncbi:MAG: hypothetical protein QM783_13860 [Phycisphaerales bacterium]
MLGWRTVILLLVLGAIVNVLVAMACARWDSAVTSRSERSDDPVDLPVDADGFLDAPTTPNQQLHRLTELSATRTTVTYMGWHQDAQWKTLLTRVHVQVRFGFPFRSLQYVGRSSQDPKTLCIDSWREEGWRGGLPLAVRQRSRLSSPFFSRGGVVYFRPDLEGVVYPLDPIGIGFVANTLIYAAMLWLPVLALDMVRRRRRRSRGLCERCKYPVGASAVCSECGAAVR